MRQLPRSPQTGKVTGPSTHFDVVYQHLTHGLNSCEWVADPDLHRGNLNSSWWKRGSSKVSRSQLLERFWAEAAPSTDRVLSREWFLREVTWFDLVHMPALRIDQLP